MSQPNATTETFQVDSALLSEIGEKLVTSPHVALAELVKNAYDADATEVQVNITPGKAEGDVPTVDVVDNGQGMTRTEVRKYWMRIGTANKVSESVSPRYGRPRTGAKGIGRFACRRLGRVLELETTALHSDSTKREPIYEHTRLLFRWDKFTPGKDVSEVQVEAATTRSSSGKTGLRLSMTHAPQDEWRIDGYHYLQRQLTVLCANRGTLRKGYEEDPGFDIELHAPGILPNAVDVNLRANLLKAGWGTLEATVNAKGNIECALRAQNLTLRKITSARTFKHIIGAKLVLGIYVMDRKRIRNQEILSKTTLAEITESFGGVQLRHRGFRIYPYGEGQDDWLDIERDRARRLSKPGDEEIFNYAKVLDGANASRSMLALLSMKNFIGAVEAPPDCHGLESKADRMGFVDNAAFRELKSFARFAIDWSMVIRDWSVQTEQEEAQHRLIEKIKTVHGRSFSVSETPQAAIKEMRRVISSLRAAIPKRRVKDVDFLDDATQLVGATLEFNKQDISRLRLVASTSTLTLLFAHEIKSMSGSLTALSEEITDVLPVIPAAKRERISQLGTDMAEAEHSLSELLDLTHAMGVINRDAGPINLNLKSVSDRAIARFKRICARYHIDITPKIPPRITVGPMLEGELLAILINVLSNAIKAVIAGGDQRVIELSAEKLKDHVQLDIRDMGIGLDVDQHDDLFKPLVADPSGILYDRLASRLNPEDALLLGHGSGLGLSIVRGMLRNRGGDAVVMPPEQGWKFHLRMNLP